MTWIRSVAWLSLAASLLACGGGAGAPAGSHDTGAKPASTRGVSQILVTVEAFAPRRVAPFGGKVAMPKLAELAGAGISYADTVTPAPLARPAVVAMLTGIAPDRSGVRDNIHDVLPGSAASLAERARDAGFETAAFVTTPFVSYASGLQRGFQVFDGPEALAIGPAQHAPRVTLGGEVASHFGQWLKTRTSNGPYFAWIHLADASSLSIPLPLPGPKSVDDVPGTLGPYDAALGSIDQALGRIAAAARESARGGKVQLIIVGTHGACLGEGNRFGESFWLTDETLRVPLVRVPDLTAPQSKGERSTRSTWLPDVAATLAVAMGVSLDARSEGVPLDQPAPEGRARIAWGYALDDQLGWPPETATCDAKHCSLVAVTPSGSGADQTADAVRARLATPRRRVLSDATHAALEKLGAKVKSSKPPTLPKDRDRWLLDLELARRFLGVDRPLLSSWRSKLILDGEPDGVAPLVTRAYFLTVNPRKDGPAVRAKLLALYPDRSDALHWGAHLFLVDKKLDEAATLFEAAREVGPVEVEMLYDLACVRSLQGRAKDALTELDAALNAGYRNWDWIDKDPDLAHARSDPGFPELLRSHGR